MKKTIILAIATIAFMSSCGGGETEKSTNCKAEVCDTTKCHTDSTGKDTTKVVKDTIK